MTNNIVAQFACSLDSKGNFKEYRVVSGSVFNEEYNETLDSATLVLSQVKKEDRLTDIRPYDYVRVYDKSGNTNFDKLFLVDTFDEKENNIKEHLFGYTINLMSETKYLEKFQCPNLVITHDINNGVINKKTIYQYIKQYMELYIPKIKFATAASGPWYYRPVIDFPKSTMITKSITVNFTDDNFSEAHGGPSGANFEFICDADSSLDPLKANFDNVHVINVQGGDDVAWIGNFDVSFDNGIFHIRGWSENQYYGSLTLTFIYEDLSNEFIQRFNIPCADMAFNCPTLRQLLTALMQQVGCIPIVKNRMLGFLDFQKDAVPFAENGDYSLDNTVNFIRRSLSSDSYVNVLANLSDNVLDSGNEVICETLGFRDQNNVLLKQQENLTLETSLPIYKVNKCILRAPGMTNGYISSSGNCVLLDTAPSAYWPSIYYKEVSVGGGNASIKFCINTNSSFPDTVVTIDRIYFLSRDASFGLYKVVETKEVEPFNLNYFTTDPDDINYLDPQSSPGIMSVRSKVLNFNNLPNDAVALMFSGTFSKNQGRDIRNFTFIRFANDDTRVTYHSLYSGISQPWFSNTDWSEESNYVNCFIARYSLSGISAFQDWDISKLVVEQSVRNLLDRDFAKMSQEMPTGDPSSWTVDKVAKYVYGTVGYTIGSKKITGFSDVYISGNQTSLGWIKRNYTYLENIVRLLEIGSAFPYSSAVNHYFEDFSNLRVTYIKTNDTEDTLSYQIYTLVNYSFFFYNPNSGSFDTSGASFFTTFFVDLYYQPLNSFYMSYVKSQEDVAIPIAQYDGNASGLTDFDRLSINEQEQVDRVGNETLFISQRTTDFSKIRDFSQGPLVFNDSVSRGAKSDIDYIIFKRSFTINNNVFNASYVGSKDAVLKDYFTSIRTKYRAYQYVNYSQSVLRKEKDLLFIRIAKDYYNGDDKVLLSNKGMISNFVYDLNNDKDSYGVIRNISYEVETDVGLVHDSESTDEEEVNQTIKNSVSAISSDNLVAFIYEYMDNIGAGPYISDITVNNHLGGVPQSWQIWGDSYSDKHSVKFASYIDFYSQATSSNGNSQIVIDKIRQVALSPIVHDDFPVTTVFSIVDNNSLSSSSADYNKRTFYKDNAERINHTVQFIYYAPDKDVLFNDNFLSGVPAINRYDNPLNCIVISENDADFYNNKNLHDLTSTEQEADGSLDSYFEFITNTTNGLPKLRTKWAANIKVMKLCHYDSTTKKYIDIATFRRNGSSVESIDFFFTINDTKTDKVFSVKDGILFLRYNVQTYTSESEVSMARNVNDPYEED